MTAFFLPSIVIRICSESISHTRFQLSTLSFSFIPKSYLSCSNFQSGTPPSICPLNPNLDFQGRPSTWRYTNFTTMIHPKALLSSLQSSLLSRLFFTSFRRLESDHGTLYLSLSEDCVSFRSLVSLTQAFYWD